MGCLKIAVSYELRAAFVFDNLIGFEVLVLILKVKLGQSA